MLEHSSMVLHSWEFRPRPFPHATLSSDVLDGAVESGDEDGRSA